MDVDCAGQHVFIGDASIVARVEAYTIEAGGALTAVAGSPFLPGVGINSAVVLLSPDDQSLYVTNQNSRSVTSLGVAHDGSLHFIAGDPFPDGNADGHGPQVDCFAGLSVPYCT